MTQTFKWNPTGTQASYTNPKSRQRATTWYDQWSPDNQLLRETSPSDSTTASIYDIRGDVLSDIDQCGNTTTYTYPTSDTDPNRDLPPTMTEMLGSTTTYSYDSYGNVTRDETQLDGDNTRSRTEDSYDSHRPRHRPEEAHLGYHR